MSTSLVAIATKFVPARCGVHVIESPHELAEHDELRSIYRKHRILSIRGRCRCSVECLSSGGLYIFHESGYSIIQENQWWLSFID